jgi:exopolysaccharide biosynthesis polyprenyl glycosylphosphotransferase
VRRIGVHVEAMGSRVGSWSIKLRKRVCGREGGLVFVSKPRKRVVPPSVLAFLDTGCIIGAYATAIHWSTPLTDPILPSVQANIPYLIVVVLVWYGAALERHLWSPTRRQDVIHYLSAVTKAVGNACVFCVFVMVLFTRGGLDHTFLVVFCVATLIYLLAFRLVLRLSIRELRNLGINNHRVMLVGANDRTVHLIEALQMQVGLGYTLEGVLDNDAERGGLVEAAGVPYQGDVASLKERVLRNEVDEVYISLPVRSRYEDIQEIAHLCEGAGVSAHLVADLFPMRVATSRLMHLEDIPLLNLSTIPEAHGKVFMKRAIDLVGSSLLILLLSPMLLLLAILVKLDSKGPVFFAQERTGQNQRRFKMMKYRSMVINAEEKQAELLDQNEMDGPVFKIKNDPRITRLGRFIRKYSLDEFPQLFNVWRGEMSLVGPRPPIPTEVEQYTWSQRRRLSIKPGMTGLWQVSGRNDVGFEEWVELDLEYIDSWSIGLDILILLKTFQAVVAGRGAS